MFSLNIILIKSQYTPMQETSLEKHLMMKRIDTIDGKMYPIW